MDVNRLFMEGESLVSVSRFGIKFHDPVQEYGTVDILSFDHTCETDYYYPEPIMD